MCTNNDESMIEGNIRNTTEDVHARRSMHKKAIGGKGNSRPSGKGKTGSA